MARAFVSVYSGFPMLSEVHRPVGLTASPDKVPVDRQLRFPYNDVRGRRRSGLVYGHHPVEANGPRGDRGVDIGHDIGCDQRNLDECPAAGRPFHDESGFIPGIVVPRQGDLIGAAPGSNAPDSYQLESVLSSVRSSTYDRHLVALTLGWQL